MPTKAPRIYVPIINPEVARALDEFTKESGIAKSQILGQLISEMTPVLQAMTESYRLAKKSPAAAVDRMRSLVQEAHIGVAQLQLDMHPKGPRKKLRRAPKRD